LLQARLAAAGARALELGPQASARFARAERERFAALYAVLALVRD
jgi:hypothetical protein